MKLNKNIIFLYFLACCYSIHFQVFGQSQTIIKGKITDAETGEGLPFVNVYFKGTNVGTTTDFEGHYTLKSSLKSDSIIASYVGYEQKTKHILLNQTQIINFQLTTGAVKLEMIEVIAGENPAFEILRKVQKNKDKNDIRSLDAYQYESYIKTEIDVDNITEKFTDKKVLRPITAIFDSLQLIAGEDGKPLLPIFIGEKLVNYYYRNDPRLEKEEKKAEKVIGIGVNDEKSFITQIVSAGFQQYNFYENWLKILGKDFVSPIAAGWKTYYDYYIVDTVMLEGLPCIKLEIEPKRKEDLAFNGAIWIDTIHYSLKQIDAKINKQANLNFIETIKIQQTLEHTTAGPSIPSKTRVLIDIDEPGEGWAGMIGKYYISNKKIIANQAKEESFFKEEDEVDLFFSKKTTYNDDEKFWVDNRHDTLTNTEISVYKMVDSVRDLPIVKTYVDIAYLVVNGYHDFGRVEIGPYIGLYANNNIEGNRFSIGLKNNRFLSRKYLFKGYLAYGSQDKEYKYKADLRYWISRKPWIEVGLMHKKDIEQLGIFTSNRSEDGLFNSFIKWGTLNEPFLITQNQVYIQKDFFNYWQLKASFSNRFYVPKYNFAYLYEQENDVFLKKDIVTSEARIETRFAYNEEYMYIDNDRSSLGTKKFPILTLGYTLGMKNILNSHFNYNKVDLNIFHNIRIGSFGLTRYNANISKILGHLPYPLLNVPLGNETPFFNIYGYNMMNYLEFVTDEQVSVMLTHRFEGLIMNRIPLMRKLKWRALFTMNMLYGRIGDDNIKLIPSNDNEGHDLSVFQKIEGYKPYIEIGYGVENIFKFIRVEVYHRLTYLSNPGARPIGIKIATQFRL